MIQVDLLTPTGKTEPASLDRPLDHLVACHRRIEDKLSVLERAVTHLEDRTEEALQACHSVFAFLDSSGMLHSEDEEESVFPRIRLQATGEELAYLDSLELQHREAEGYIARLKNLTKQLERDPSLPATREALAQTAGKLVTLYRAHIASENEVLTRIGRARLDEVALAEISFEMRVRRSHGV
jgi:iron-sulfur cluster repair protein YtfE (RIC family)